CSVRAEGGGGGGKGGGGGGWRRLRCATAGYSRVARISERIANALPPTATSTMTTKRLVAAAAEPAPLCPAPDALAGAEDELGVASGDDVSAPIAGVDVPDGVGRGGGGVAPPVGAVTTMVTGPQSLTDEIATDDAPNWCWPAAAHTDGGPAGHGA